MTSASPASQTTAREDARIRARRLLLALSQAELELRLGDAALLRHETAQALAACGKAYDWQVRAIEADTMNVASLLHLALQCTIVSICPCGLAIDGAMWPRLPLVGVQRTEGEPTLELRNCLCGSTRSVVIPAMGGA